MSRIQSRVDTERLAEIHDLVDLLNVSGRWVEPSPGQLQFRTRKGGVVDFPRLDAKCEMYGSLKGIDELNEAWRKLLLDALQPGVETVDDVIRLRKRRLNPA